MHGPRGNRRGEPLSPRPTAPPERLLTLPVHSALHRPCPRTARDHWQSTCPQPLLPSISSQRDSAMKISLSSAELLDQLQTASRVASTRSAVQALSGVMISPPADGSPELLATDMEIGLRDPARPRRSRAPARPCSRRACCSTSRARCPAEQLTMELRAAEQDVELICGPTHVPPAHAPRRGLPHRCPSPRGDTRVTLPRRRLRRDDHARRALGLARRDAPGPHRDPDVGLGAGAADGRHRLLPAERQGDGARGAARRAASRRTCPRGRCRSWRGSRSRRRAEEVAVSVGQNQAIFELGGRRAVLAADRRPVPELPPAAARVRRARAAPRERGARRTSCGGSACSRRRTRRCG